MNQFIYWGVFAAFGIIVVLYLVWMWIADRLESNATGPGSAMSRGTPPLHLLSESQRREAIRREGSGSPSTRSQSGGTGDDRPGGPEDPPEGDGPTRTFWRGK